VRTCGVLPWFMGACIHSARALGLVICCHWDLSCNCPMDDSYLIISTILLSLHITIIAAVGVVAVVVITFISPLAPLLLCRYCCCPTSVGHGPPKPTSAGGHGCHRDDSRGRTRVRRSGSSASIIPVRDSRPQLPSSIDLCPPHTTKREVLVRSKRRWKTRRRSNDHHRPSLVAFSTRWQWRDFSDGKGRKRSSCSCDNDGGGCVSIGEHSSRISSTSSTSNTTYWSCDNRQL
jgi:hypothetical protein